MAHVFKSPNDWDAGELLIGPRATKPWRYTHQSLVSLRVLEGGCAWLHMERADAMCQGPAPDADEHTPRRTPGLRSPTVCKELSDTARKLCPGDWVCIPPCTWYMLTGSLLVDRASAHRQAHDHDAPSCRCIFFVRSHAATVNH